MFVNNNFESKDLFHFIGRQYSRIISLDLFDEVFLIKAVLTKVDSEKK